LLTHIKYSFLPNCLDPLQETDREVNIIDFGKNNTVENLTNPIAFDIVVVDHRRHA